MSGFFKGGNAGADKRKIDRYIKMYKDFKRDPDTYNMTPDDIQKIGRDIKKLIEEYKQMYGAR